MGFSRVFKAVPAVVLAFAFPVFAQEAGRPGASRPEEAKPLIAQPGSAQSTTTQPGSAQSAATQPVIVQPGAPGQPSRILPADTRAVASPISPKDIEFMEGMILHHSQAVEMTSLIEDRTDDPDIRLLGAKIMQSQADEMDFMKRWLKSVGQGVSGAGISGAVGQWGRQAVGQRSDTGAGWRSNSDSHSASHQMSHEGMPGMLSPQQMNALKRASGKDFDRLFLLGMIQHHEGALVMVKDLFDTAGAGQNAELFGFANDVDSGQRAEIVTMKNLLKRKFPEGGN